MSNTNWRQRCEIDRLRFQAWLSKHSELYRARACILDFDVSTVQPAVIQRGFVDRH